MREGTDERDFYTERHVIAKHGREVCIHRRVPLKQQIQHGQMHSSYISSQESVFSVQEDPSSLSALILLHPLLQREAINATLHRLTCYKLINPMSLMSQ